MKRLFVVFFLVGIGFSLSAKTSPTPSTIILKSIENTPNIFFADSENNILFIDFALLSNKVQQIKVKRKKKVVLSKNTKAISAHAIYELHLEDLKKGKYIIELHTENQSIIQKVIQIK